MRIANQSARTVLATVLALRTWECIAAVVAIAGILRRGARSALSVLAIRSSFANVAKMVWIRSALPNAFVYWYALVSRVVWGVKPRIIKYKRLYSEQMRTTH